jgi:uncharacterized protein
MQTTIGQTLHGSPRLAAVGLLGAVAVAADLALICWNEDYVTIEGRGAAALLGMAAYVCLLGGDLPSLGLTIRPIQGWRYWIKAALLIGLVVAAFVAVGLGACFLVSQRLSPDSSQSSALPICTVRPEAIGSSFLHACLFAPVLEETTYRLLICVPLAGGKRPWTAIATSGVAFAAVHFLYGNPSPGERHRRAVPRLGVLEERDDRHADSASLAGKLRRSRDANRGLVLPEVSCVRSAGKSTSMVISIPQEVISQTKATLCPLMHEIDGCLRASLGSA